MGGGVGGRRLDRIIIPLYLCALVTLTIDKCVRLNETYCFIGFEESDGPNSTHAWDDGFIGICASSQHRDWF